MPQPIWPPQPVTSAGDYYQPEPEPRGLFGFMGQDFGNEIGPRLGVISQILMGLGSGRGPGDVAGELGKIEERSKARREKRKAERMVARAANKIRDRDPELADMMMANTAFGMELIGKKYESEWRNAADMEQLRERLKLEGSSSMDQLRERLKLEGANARELKQLELDQINKRRTEFLASLTGGGGGGTSPSTAVLPTGTVTESSPGTEASTGAVERLVPTTGDVVADVAIATPAPVTTDAQAIVDPLTQKPIPQPYKRPKTPPMAPLSQDETLRSLQISLTPQLGTVYEKDAALIWEYAGKGEGLPGTVIEGIRTRYDNEQKRLEDLSIAEIRDAQGRAFQTQEAQAGRAAEAAQPGIRQAEFETRLDPVTGKRGPMVRGYVPPDTRTVQVLQEAGFDDQDIREMPDPEVQAGKIIDGVRKGDPLQAKSDVTKALEENRKLIRGQQADVLSGREGAKTVRAIQETIVPDRTGQHTQLQERYINQLDVIKRMPDPKEQAKALDDATKSYEQARQNIETNSVARESLELDKQKAALEKDTHDRAIAAEEERIIGEEDVTQNRAQDITDNMDQMIKVMDDPSVASLYGVPGWFAGWIPGTPADTLNFFATSIESALSVAEGQTLRKYSVTGAGLGGNTSDKDMEALRTDVANLRTAQFPTREAAEFAMKKIYNRALNMLTPDSGDRFDINDPGFHKKPFDMKRDNPVLFRRQQKKYKDLKPGESIVPMAP